LVLSGFPNTFHVKIFFQNSKIRKLSYMYTTMEAYLAHSWGGDGTMGCVSISSDLFEFFKHFSARNFFPIPRIRKVREKPQDMAPKGDIFLAYCIKVKSPHILSFSFKQHRFWNF